jgi:probable rRNA maturation factor
MTLCFRNRQRVCPIDVRLLRRIVRHALDHHFGAKTCELCLHLVEAKEMAHINEKFLQHLGPTDVITFSDAEGRPGLHGEIFICPEVAISQAREFRTSWQQEIVRYAIHGLLHLQGHDDRSRTAQKAMKREEDRIVEDVIRQFAVARLRRPRVK